MTDRAREVAASLSEAQRAAILSLPDRRYKPRWLLDGDDRSVFRSMPELVMTGFASSDDSPPPMNAALTPFGLEVRHILDETATGGHSC